MFQWYANSEVCIVYLSDVLTANSPRFDLMGKFRASRWFTRGWTLQELIAPKKVEFYAADWTRIGSKHDDFLLPEIHAVTKVPPKIVTGEVPVSHASISQRMSWVAGRTTTRIEDVAYRMMGIFDVNMLFLYGEGMKAFVRLQEEIIKISNDHTIFCWTWLPSVPDNWVSLLAPFPDTFRDGHKFDRNDYVPGYGSVNSPYSMTNTGLSIELPVIYTLGDSFLVLRVSVNQAHQSHTEIAGVPVHARKVGNALVAQRIRHPAHPVMFFRQAWGPLETQKYTVKARLQPRELPLSVTQPPTTAAMALLVAFDSTDLSDDLLLHITPYSRSTGLVIDIRRSLVSFCEPPSDRNDVAGGLVVLTYSSADSLSHEAYLFLAAKLTGDSVKWYCQIFVEEELDDTRKTESGRASLLEILLKQVGNVTIEHKAHFHRNMNLSVIIGDHRIEPYGSLREVRTLYLSRGRRHYKVGGRGDGPVLAPILAPEDGVFQIQRSKAKSRAVIKGS